MNKVFLFIILLSIATATTAAANPTQTGETGLITVPTADTLDAGNICLGVWTNYAHNGVALGNSTVPRKDALIVPVTITLGLGSFWEVYGTYPNVLFNREELYSGRGTAKIGTKLRFWGNRSSNFKLAADFSAQRHITQDATNGNTDIGARLIASLRNDIMGIHIYGGYLVPKGTIPPDYRNEVLYGGGYEFSPSTRTKLTLELTGNTSRDRTISNPMETSVGFQYYISPHLTFNVAAAYGLSSGSPDWRTVVGFSSCQGVGSYLRPVKSTFTTPDELGEKKAKLVKPVKITPISPLLRSPAPTVPLGKMEVPVDSNEEEIIIRPYGQISIPQQAAARVVSTMTPPQPANSPTTENNEASQTATTPEVKIEQPETVSMKQEGAAVVSTEQGTETAEDASQGVTPLYAIDNKDQKVELATMKAEKIPAVMKVYRKFRFPDVSFDFDQWSLSVEGKRQLSEVAEQIRNDKKWVYIRIDGHTDSIGSVNYNMDLSLKRAISVAAYLINREGIDPSRLFLKGMGKTRPIADNATSEGRRQNRRSEVLLLIPKDQP